MTSDRTNNVAIDARLLGHAVAVTRPRAASNAAVVDRALRMYVGHRVLTDAQATTDLGDAEADALAVEELRSVRRRAV